jgi:hypothetical protein
MHVRRVVAIVRARSFIVWVAVVVASTVCIAVGTGTSAGATGATHRLLRTSEVNGSPAVEKPAVMFACNDFTGAYRFKATNVSVIGPDHTSEWLDLTVTFWLFDSTNDWSNSGLITLSQNATNGLFTATSSGYLQPTFNGRPSTALCATGVTLSLMNLAEDSLRMSWTLT